MGLQAPLGRTPEIWIGAHGPRMLELTGRFGDGWLPTVVSSPEDYGQMWQAVRAAAVRAGRSPEAITAGLACYLLLARDEREVRTLLRSQMVRYLALMAPAGAWAKVGADHPLGPRFGGFVDMLPERLDPGVTREAMRSVPEEVAAVGVMVGTPDDVVTRVRALAEAGLNHFSPVLLSGLVSRGNALHDMHAYPAIARRLRSGR